MFDNLSRLFRKTEVGHINLVFDMDLNSKGQHIIHVSRECENGLEQIQDINKLLAYDYHEESHNNSRQHISILKTEDRQTILSLKSLNPEIRKDGSLVFDIEPPILSYLRKKEIPETKQSKTVKILSDPIKPTAEITYDNDSGIHVKTGYKLKNQHNLITADKLKLTSDGKFTRIGNTFVPIEKPTGKVAELLMQGEATFGLDEIPEFFLRDLVMIKNEFNAVLTDLAGKIQIITDPLVPVVKVEKDPQGWLDFDIHYTSRDLSIPRNLILKAKAEENKYLQLDQSTWIKLDNNAIDQTEKKLRELEADITSEGFRLPASEFASLEEFIDKIGGKRVLSEAYQEFLNQLSGFQADEEFQLSEDLEQQLKTHGFNIRPYQRAGIHWLEWLRQNQLHGVLADDMGLGKTMQSLIALRLGYEDSKIKNHSLIIAPKSVLQHWENEINRIFYFFRVYIYHGSNRSRKIFRSSMPYIFITTYETVARDIDFLATIPFYYLILDEATRIKNPDTQRSQAIKSLNAEHRLALSGIPVENRPAELWSLFDFLMKGHLGKHGTFVRLYEESIMAGQTSAAQQLGRRIKPFLLRRKKEAVANDLPPKIILTEWVDLTEEQRNLYGTLQDSMKNLRSSIMRGDYVNYTTNILPVLTKLKQICDHPALFTGETEPIMGRSDKFDFIIEKIDEIIDNGEQVIIFSHFLGMLSLLENIMREKRFSYIRIDGSTNQRQSLIDKFNDGTAKVALLSIMAAGYGINLTAANHVIHADRWWNPAVEDQATDRVHRIGQKKTVFIHHFLTNGTLEEKIDRLLSKKRGIADQIIGAASEGEHRWSREELLELLKPLD